MTEEAMRAALRGIHLQVMGAQASLAAIDHSLIQLLGGAGGDKADTAPADPAVPPRIASTSEELRSLLGKPTLEEIRKNVFMPKTASTPASGTPSGDTPSVPSELRSLTNV